MFATKHIINHETKEITIYLLTLSLVWIPNTLCYIFKLIGNATYQYRRLCTVYVRSSCCHVLTLPEPLCFSIQYEHKLSCLLVFLRFSQIIIFK